MGNVIFVLTVVAFWAIAFVLVVFLIRMALRAPTDEQEVLNTPAEHGQDYEAQSNTPALN